jgi:hypothetical protein
MRRPVAQGEAAAERALLAGVDRVRTPGAHLLVTCPVRPASHPHVSFLTSRDAGCYCILAHRGRQRALVRARGRGSRTLTRDPVSWTKRRGFRASPISRTLRDHRGRRGTRGRPCRAPRG